MNHLYLLALLFSLAGVTAIDFRFRLAFFALPKVAFVSLLVPYVMLIVWDLVGIAQEVFFKGESPVLLEGWLIAPNFPLEELLFLALLCYTSLITVAAFGRRK